MTGFELALIVCGLEILTVFLLTAGLLGLRGTPDEAIGGVVAGLFGLCSLAGTIGFAIVKWGRFGPLEIGLLAGVGLISILAGRRVVRRSTARDDDDFSRNLRANRIG